MRCSLTANENARGGPSILWGLGIRDWGLAGADSPANRCPLTDLDDDRGDVVLASPGIGELDQASGGKMAAFRQDRRNFFELQIAMQAVAAEQVRIAHGGLPDTRIHLYVVPAADGAC